MADAIGEFEQLYVRPRVGRTLIVGSYITTDKPDRRALYSEVLGVDMRPGPGVDVVLNMEDEHDIGRFLHVECTSVLEHARRPWRISENIENMLAPGGTLYVSVPFAWRLHSYPDDYFRMSLSALRSLFENVEWLALKYATYQGLKDGPKLPGIIHDGYRFCARTTACGFGVRK